MRTILGSLHGLALLALQCSAFLSLARGRSLMSNALLMMMSAKEQSHLHLAEYPDDDYSHTLGFGDPEHKLSKLQMISALCIAETTRNKIPIDTDGCGIDKSMYISEAEMVDDIIELDASYGRPLNLYQKLRSVGGMAIAAEFKRASPSKGDINIQLDVVQQTLGYAEMGASVISVLTETVHFKGTLLDMKQVRMAVQREYGRERPVVLRKDFIFDRYQILEARAHGADTVLLIVAVLGVQQLGDLIAFARGQGMEPLVEAHTPEEMAIAVKAGAVVIGVNNRNLHDFRLDLETTARALEAASALGVRWGPEVTGAVGAIGDRNAVDFAKALVAEGRICVAALSGITSAADVKLFRDQGVECCLVGETLMKAADPKAALGELLGHTGVTPEQVLAGPVLVKTCGVTRAEDALAAVRAGANLVGVIFAKDSPRSVQQATAQEVGEVAVHGTMSGMGMRAVQRAREIVAAVRGYGEREGPVKGLQRDLEALRLKSQDAAAQAKRGGSGQTEEAEAAVVDWYLKAGALIKRVSANTPLVVGVFQNQRVEEINEVISSTGIDLVQLHGNESPEMIDQIWAPVIKVAHVSTFAVDVGEEEGEEAEAERATAAAEATEAVAAALRYTASAFSGKAVCLLFDAQLPGTQGGGTGKAFDWGLVDHLRGVPVILAGGLGPHNVAEAVCSASQPHRVMGVDVSSGVEGAVGVKDAAKVEAFVANARNARK